MNHRFERMTNVSDIVTKVPQASDLFKKHRIDFCCGGNRPLAEAIEERNLNEEEILEQLDKLYDETFAENQTKTDWTTAPYSNIINHVVKKHHGYLTQELTPLSQFVTKVYRVHGGDRPELADVHQLFFQLKDELLEHLQKEEEAVFPLIKDYEVNPTPEKLEKLRTIIAELESEHDVAGAILSKIRDVTNDFELPQGACMTYQLTYRRLEDLESDMFQHVHLENNILFPRIFNEKIA
ncbi:iron-sulfur cluster repair di-iron protein [Desertibacillus haloalkaliphilus]|uniref:iron-sulfur cluster repair di-iron protein n=1 Tax=Desertibacillus haloalkaliphilus TaxID=1328930 RepID=UPI001C26A8D5|nr:iron-sulfur cluster repair di-iron protein [Desertibacillus haloalkaliphilus]MBU8908013.1 iron-sulfur cluster repair di-iron protein [Desertibacillus haloalkaliphilus]